LFISRVLFLLGKLLKCIVWEENVTVRPIAHGNVEEMPWHIFVVSASMGWRFEQEEGVELMGQTLPGKFAEAVPDVEDDCRGVRLAGLFFIKVYIIYFNNYVILLYFP
jgi:hypothetical protein